MVPFLRRKLGAGGATGAKRRREANGRPSRPPIPVGGTIAAAARAAIRDPWRILAAAIAVSAVTALLDILADDLVDKTNLPLVLATSLSATGAATFRDVLLSASCAGSSATPPMAPRPRSGPLSGRWLRICRGAA